MKYRVPVHLIPSRCPLCKREVVRTPVALGKGHQSTILIDYDTIKPIKKSNLLEGTEHNCQFAGQGHGAKGVMGQREP